MNTVYLVIVEMFHCYWKSLIQKLQFSGVSFLKKFLYQLSTSPPVVELEIYHELKLVI